MSKKIDYLNLSKYVKLPHDRQPAYIGHVNYAIENSGSSEPVVVTYTEFKNQVTANVNVNSGDIFTLDLQGINAAATTVNIFLTTDGAGTLAEESGSYGAKQLWIRWGAGTSSNVTTTNLQAAKYPLDVQPSFSVGQNAIDAITIQTGVFDRFLCIATLAFDGQD